MRGADTNCSSQCAANVHSLLNDTGCCAQCIILGFNASYANFTLPSIDTVLERLSMCTDVNATEFDLCGAPALLQERLVIDNLKFSFASSQPDLVKSCVASAVSSAAAIDASSVTVSDVIDNSNGVAFNVTVEASSSREAELVAESLYLVASRNLMNLSAIESAAFGNMDSAMYNHSEPFVTHVSTLSNAGSAVASFSSIAVLALVTMAVALLV